MLSGYESNLFKLMVECLDRQNKQLENLNTNLTNLNNNLTGLNEKFNTFNYNFDLFNGRFLSCIVLDDKGNYWFRVWTPNS